VLGDHITLYVEQTPWQTPWHTKGKAMMNTSSDEYI
jgi:hypothetical protein